MCFKVQARGSVRFNEQAELHGDLGKAPKLETTLQHILVRIWIACGEFLKCRGDSHLSSQKVLCEYSASYWLDAINCRGGTLRRR